MHKIFRWLPINGHSNNKMKAESIFHYRKCSKSCPLRWPSLPLLSVGRVPGAQKSHVPNLYCIQMFTSLMHQFIFDKIIFMCSTRNPTTGHYPQPLPSVPHPFTRIHLILSYYTISVFQAEDVPHPCSLGISHLLYCSTCSQSNTGQMCRLAK
jgi:hypothetical protein